MVLVVLALFVLPMTGALVTGELKSGDDALWLHVFATASVGSLPKH